MPALPQKPAPLAALTGLRFFLAIWVVLFHFARFPAAGFPVPVKNILSSGFLGVDVFFLLSGFLMAYNYLDGAGALVTTNRHFWAARFARIYPVYFA